MVIPPGKCPWPWDNGGGSGTPVEGFWGSVLRRRSTAENAFPPEPDREAEQKPAALAYKDA